MNCANYSVCPFWHCDYNTGLCLPKFLPWTHTACLSCLTRADILGCDFEWAVCNQIFDIGDPTDLEVDIETVHVIEIIKEREGCKREQERHVYGKHSYCFIKNVGRESHNYFTPARSLQNREARTDVLSRKYKPAVTRFNYEDEK